jgi:2-succinyl-6-hydroxy-2,4-cyclohexadiene-1-carboxylate synthase
VIAALRERYRAVAPDIRGHGDAAAAVPVTLEAVIADIEALAPPRAFTLAGYSMGGRISLHAALAMPARVGRLVLIGASPGIADVHERIERRLADEQLAGEIERSSIEEFAAQWARAPVLSGMPDDVLARVQRDRLRNAPTGLARALRGLGTGALPSLWGRLEELQMPVTLVVGERDQKFRVIAEQMRELIPESELLVAPGVGHAVHIEAPEEVAEAIVRGETIS